MVVARVPLVLSVCYRFCYRLCVPTRYDWSQTVPIYTRSRPVLGTGRLLLAPTGTVWDTCPMIRSPSLYPLSYGGERRYRTGDLVYGRVRKEVPQSSNDTLF